MTVSTEVDKETERPMIVLHRPAAATRDDDDDAMLKGTSVAILQLYLLSDDKRKQWLEELGNVTTSVQSASSFTIV